MSVTARFPGICAECGGRFPEGAEITAIREREWVHVKCPDDVILPDTAPPACPECFMVLPCMCGYYERGDRSE